jgi:hypothetical protein
MISFFSVLPSKALIHGINFVITFSSLAFSIKKNTIRDDIIKITTPINIKTALFSNRVLLFIYLLLVGIFLSIRYPSTFADDPWFHVIYSINYLEYNPSLYTAYRGLFGFFIAIGNNILIAGSDPALIIKWISVITVPCGAMLLLAISDEVMKKKEFSVIFVTIMAVFPLGYIVSISQLWPTMLGVFQGLAIILIMIQLTRHLDESQLKTRNFYIFLTITVLSVIITHDFIAFLFIGALTFVSLLEFKDPDRKKQAKKKLIISWIYVGMLFGYQFLIDKLCIYNLFKVGDFLKYIPDYLLPILIPVLIIIGILIIKLIFKFVHAETYFPENENDIYREGDNVWINYIRKGLVKTYFIAPIAMAILIILFFNVYLGYPFSSSLFVIGLSVLTGLTVINCICAFFIIRRRGNPQRALPRIIVFFLISFILLFVVSLSGNKFFLWTRLPLVCIPYVTLFEFKLFDEFFDRRDLIKKYKALILGISILFISFGLICENSYSEYKNESELEIGVYFGQKTGNNDRTITGFRWWYYVQYNSNNNSRYFRSGPEIFPGNQTEANDTCSIFKKYNNSLEYYIILDETQIERGVVGIDEQSSGKFTKEIQDEYYNLTYFDRVVVCGDVMVYHYNYYTDI